MFKQMKSALFWYYLFKFRKRAIIIVLLLLIALFSNFIYADIVEYLKLKNRLQYLEIALILKWIIIIFNLTFSIYLILTLFKKDDEFEEKEKNKPKKDDIKHSAKDFSQREKDLLYKKTLKTKADMLLGK
ncbi:MAG TPA: hypothetical protein K8U92_07430 [Aliarcobacter thereius]|jgi:hypothetical protein|nr:hypothetical protein [Aliarcobacter thereius]HJE03692.1 hypothetical protein [Aliarcobacter thereius]